MSDPNGRPVSRDLWYEAHRNLADRVAAIERRHEREDEEAHARALQAASERRSRTWQFVIGAALALLPLLIAALIASGGTRP